MKQALISDDGLTVANVRDMPVDTQGNVILPEADTYAGPVLLLDDSAYCGVGMLWDQSEEHPLFTYSADLQAENLGWWDKLKNLFA